MSTRRVLIGLLLFSFGAGAQSLSSVQGGIPGSPAPALPETPKQDKATVEGTVSNSVTGELLRKVNLVLRRDGNPGSRGRDAATYAAETDAAGHFEIKDVEPGRYRLSAERTGYVRSDYGSKAPMMPGSVLPFNAGQKMKDADFRLTPQGVIAGRVVDEDGDPLQNVMVQCMRYSYVRGKRQLAPMNGQVTNDLGEFRIHGLAPGKYYLSASYRNFNRPGDSASTYSPVYYPNGSAPAQGTPIEVLAGSQVRGIEFALQRARSYRISGQLNGITHNVNLLLVQRDSSVPFFGPQAFSHSLDDKGNFVLASVAPGNYTLIAEHNQEGKRYQARVPVDVTSGNVEGVQVTLAPQPDVSGKVRVEGDASYKLNSIRVMLEPHTMTPFGGAAAGPVKDDGTFKLASVGADAMTVAVFGLPDTAYVKSVRLGEQDVTDKPIDFSQGLPAAELQITIAPTGGEVNGTVQNAKQENAAAVFVVLVPEPEKRDVPQLYKTATTDQNGRFTLKGVRPGEYKLFSWEQVEFGAWQDPDFLKQYEDQGQPVAVKDGSTETKQLKVIAEKGS